MVAVCKYVIASERAANNPLRSRMWRLATIVGGQTLPRGRNSSERSLSGPASLEVNESVSARTLLPCLLFIARLERKMFFVFACCNCLHSTPLQRPFA